MGISLLNQESTLLVYFHREVHLGAVHFDEGHEVVIEPLLSELQVVSRGGQEMNTSSAVQVLQPQQILERHREM